jgi:hypothetical protein
MDRGAAPRVEATLWVRQARRRVQFWTFTMSKSAAPTGAVITGARAHGSSARTNARVLSAHEMSLDVLRLVLRAICPPALAAEGGPCAGYSGFSLELCSGRWNELEAPQ